MAYRRTPPQADDKTAIALALVAKNPKISAIIAGLTLTALVGVLAPSQQVRGLAQNTSCLMGGVFVTFSAYQRVLGALQAEVTRCRDKAAAVASRAAELELEAQRLVNVEATMKDRITNQVQANKNREIDRARSQLERKLASSERSLEATKAKLAKAVVDLNSLKLAHSEQIVAINADAQSAQQAAVDAAIVEKQVELDKAFDEIAIAQSETKTAKQTLYRAEQELEAHRGQMGEANARFNKSLAKATHHVFQQQAAVLDEAGLEAEKSIQKTALELQWEKRERLRLAAENTKLKAPKICPNYGPQGDMARKIQGVVHGLTVERSKDGRRILDPLGYRMHWVNVREEGTTDVFMFESLTGTADDFNRKKAEIQQALRGANLERIEYNPNTSCIEFSVSARKKNTVSDRDFKRLVKSDAYYLKRAATWPRTQFLAPSESGKTSSAEIIGYQWANANNGDRFFHYPNKESVKNYVTANIVSVGAEKCAESFASLVHLVDDIQDGRKPPLAQKQHHVFDDSDSIIAKALGGLITRDEILDFFTRASHCGIAFTLIGHSTSANRQGGMTHSDFNNLVRIYSGLDILTALANTQVVSTNRAETLKTQYEKIRDRFDLKNAELGLAIEGDTADPGAYRFVLVIEPNKAPYFCELPQLDLLSADSSGHPTAAPQTGHSHPRPPTAIATPQRPLQSSNASTAAVPLETVGTPQQTPTVRKCRKCGGKLESQGIVKSGKHKGERKYVCRGAKHTRAMGAKTHYFDA